MNQKLFSSGYVEKLKTKILDGSNISYYFQETFPVNEEFVFENPDIAIAELPTLKFPSSSNDLNNFENGKIIYEAYKHINPVQATDSRIWTYMTHVTFWDYMKERMKFSNINSDNASEYILKHFFIEKIQQRYLFDNHISALWWVCHETYDYNREDPYQLTREAFSMIDYTRDLIGSSLGLDKKFLHAFLETVIENSEIFSTNKEAKKRRLMRKMNFIAGRSILTTLDKEEIKNMISKFLPDIGKM